MGIPVVKRDEKGIYTLYVNDRPFFLRSGEIHNSSASSREFMEEKLWPQLRGMNLNSIIAPVYWELIEAEEGVYDFSSVDTLIEGARKEGLKLVILWFGLWKNAESMYIPAWMKRDPETYFLAQKVNGDRIQTVSPLCRAAVEKDKAAFTALMKHIREFDGDEQTVVVMQVENEIGLLGTERDYSPAANEAFDKPVPEKLAEITGRSGTWKEVFGEDAEESFMAWQFASAVETIASAGRAEYALPCYCNAWLKQYPWYVGSYPSGGPVPDVQKIWRAAAPSLFAFGPDIYVPYCADVMDEYAGDDNPLFVPEIRKDAVTASYALYAFGAKNAICYSPFGIEDLSLDPSEIDKPPMEVMAALNIDPSAFATEGSKEYLARTYQLLADIEPLILKYRGTEKLQAFVRHSDTDYGTLLHFEEVDAAVAYAPKAMAKPLGAGIFIELGKNQFLIVGMQCTVAFRAKAGVNAKVDLIRFEEGSFVENEWQRGRVLNGDEKMSIQLRDMPAAFMVEVYQY